MPQRKWGPVRKMQLGDFRIGDLFVDIFQYEYEVVLVQSEGPISCANITVVYNGARGQKISVNGIQNAEFYGRKKLIFS